MNELHLLFSLGFVGKVHIFSVASNNMSGKQGAKSSYETSLKSNRRTAEYRISNVEGLNRFAQSF